MEGLRNLFFILTFKMFCQLQDVEPENALHLPTGVERKVDMEYINTENLVPLEDPKKAAEVVMVVIYAPRNAHSLSYCFVCSYLLTLLCVQCIVHKTFVLLSTISL